MRMLRAPLATILLLTCAASAQALVTPIDSLHYDYSNGIPLFQTPLRYVTVQGTVTSPDNLFSTTNTDVYIQDATGGVNVFVGGVPAYNFALGDSVEVSGYVKTFNGNNEIDSTAALVSVTHLGPALFPPDPMVITCSQLANGFSAGPPAHEPYEGRLVRINGVHLTAGAWPTTPQTANRTLTIADLTGSCTLFIDKDTAVDGTPDPGAKFDVIGIAKQFDSTVPYTTGYELDPRFPTDVIPECPGPGFATPPTETAVTDQTATIEVDSSSPSTLALTFGPSTAYGDSITDGLFASSHSVTIGSLAARTLYHMQARVTDANGSCFSQDRVFFTYPADGTPGDIAVYFNQTVSTDVQRPGVPAAQGSQSIQSRLLTLINSATTSIDCALYSFSLQNVTNALINAHNNRGVTVRLILDAGNSAAQANQLQANGIPYITSTYGGNHGQAQGGGIMHSKYVIVDGQAADKNLAYLWTGSWNCSVSGENDAQNTIVFHDYGLAQAYTLDFNQMWGSATTAPSSSTSRMGSRKAEVIPHLFKVGGIPIEAWMSPSDGTENRMIEQIQQTSHTQFFAILDFTSDPLSHAMKVHRDSIPGFAVRGLFEPTQISSASEWCKLDGQPSCADFWTPRADVLQDGSTAFDLLHHKYMILDEGYPNATTITGSHNFSNAANTTNDENTVVVHDPTIANLYMQEFWARYLESGGVAAGVDPRRAVARLELAQSLPNPSAGETRIPFALPRDAARARLAIYDLSGRRVRALIDGPVSAGRHEVRWDGRDDGGHAVEAGVYFYRLSAGAESAVRRLAFMR